jgi:uncharacterized RDD family membrane protein YckC
MNGTNYPGVFDRVRAIVVDAFVLILLMMSVSYIFSLFENVPVSTRIIAFVFIFFLYDPLFTCVFGATLGHMLIGIRVKRESDETNNILFPQVVLRFIVKAGLGEISLFTVLSNPKRKAIHDYLVGSVVVYANPSEDSNVQIEDR